MYRLVIKTRAIIMAKEAYGWYEKQQIGLDDRFLQQLDLCYDKIEIWPAAYDKIKKNFRQIIVKPFPCVVVFEIIKTDVIVYAVFYTSRDPKNKFQK